MSTIVLHHLEKSRSHRILWLLEELGLDYTMTRYPRHPKTIRAPKSLRDVHPLGKSPIVEVDGQVLAETGAIIEFLLDLVPDSPLRPQPGTPEHQAFRYYLHYAEGSLMPPLLLKLVIGQLAGPRAPKLVRPLMRRIVAQVDDNFTDPEIALHTATLNAALQGKDWFVGDALTAADIQLSYPIETLLTRGDGGAPNLSAWVTRIRAEPAYQRAVEVGGSPNF